MASQIEYTPNPPGMDALGRSAAIRSIVVGVASVGAAYAQAMASRYSRSGTHANSYVVETSLMPSGRRNALRHAATITNTAPYSAAVEFGSRSRGRTGRRILRETIPIMEGGN